MSAKKITFYGATWCSDCTISQQTLDKFNVPYVYINIDKDPQAAKEVERINNGYQSIPTIVFPDGTIMVEPSTAELQMLLEKQAK